MSEPKLTRRQQAEMYLKEPNMRRYLDLLSYTEGTQKNGYYTTFGGGKIDDLSRHPNRIWGKTGDGPTSATGRYQFLTDTWNEQAKLLGLQDFGAESQDLAAVSLIMRRGAVQDILSGDIDAANRKLSKEWASLPYNNSPHQSQKSVEEVAQEWARLGGKDYFIPSQQYDYSTTQPNTLAQQFTPNPLPTSTNTGIPLASAFAQPAARENNDLVNAFEQLNGTHTAFSEPEPPKRDNSQYDKQLAEAFGIAPSTKGLIPDYIGEMIKSIYDQTA